MTRFERQVTSTSAGNTSIICLLRIPSPSPTARHSPVSQPEEAPSNNRQVAHSERLQAKTRGASIVKKKLAAAFPGVSASAIAAQNPASALNIARPRAKSGTSAALEKTRAPRRTPHVESPPTHPKSAISQPISGGLLK